MARVGDESPHPLFVALAGVQRRADVIQQGVQGFADAPDLGAWIGLMRGNAFSDRDLALVEGQGGDPFGGVGHRAQRREALRGSSRRSLRREGSVHPA